MDRHDAHGGGSGVGYACPMFCVVMEEMPEDFPPRVMFDNVAATRANTDQILALLRNGSSARAGDHTTAVN